jgi:D-glycero-alpha-D-manno-heptose 1-phosphate guanylyltransferase
LRGRTQAYGPGGGLTYSTEACESEPQAWLVLNGDSLVFFDLDKITVSLSNANGVIITRAVPDTSRYGSVRTDDTARITAFEEKQPGFGHVNAGIYLLRHEVLRDFPDHCPLSLECEVFPYLLSHNAGLRPYQVEAPFLDIGTPEILLQTEAIIEENQAQFA